MDETTALLWDVILPSGGPRETAIMGDILGTGANEDADTAKVISPVIADEPAAGSNFLFRGFFSLFCYC